MFIFMFTLSIFTTTHYNDGGTTRQTFRIKVAVAAAAEVVDVGFLLHWFSLVETKSHAPPLYLQPKKVLNK